MNAFIHLIDCINFNYNIRALLELKDYQDPLAYKVILDLMVHRVIKEKKVA